MREAPPARVSTPVLRALEAGADPLELGVTWPAVGGARAGGVPVTFAAWAPAGHEVLVHVNGLTDRFRESFEWALLPEVSRRGEEALHAASFLMPPGLNCSYRVVKSEHVPRDAGRSRPGWLAVHQAGRPDPLAPQIMPTVLGADASLLTLPGAKVHPAWAPKGPMRRGPERRYEMGPGVSLWDHGRHDGVVVLFDAEQWEKVGLARALRAAESTPPLILAVDSGFGAEAGAAGASAEFAPERRTRANFLPYPERVEAVVGPVLEHVRWHYPGLTRDRVMATGQSYGGLAAVGLVTAGARPAGFALAQSASLHFAPGHGRPQGQGELGTLISGLGGRERGLPGSIELVAGTEEHGMCEVAAAAVGPLTAAGHHVSLRSVAGGHDYAWWRHELLDTLERWRPGRP